MPGPRSLEEFLYLRLMRSPAFHRFVRSVYYKLNGIDPAKLHNKYDHGVRFDADVLFQPTPMQKFKAFRALWWDEMRHSIGLNRKHNV